MEKKLTEIEFAFLRLAVFCIENNLLSWNSSSSSTYNSRISNELVIEFRYYDNKSRPDVYDITFSYKYTDRNHINNSDRMFLRIEERHGNYFQLFRFKYLFNKVVEFSKSNFSKSKNVDLVFIINEIERAESNDKPWNTPFDFDLLKSCYKELIK